MNMMALVGSMAIFVLNPLIFGVGVTTVKAYHAETYFTQNMLEKAKELVDINWKTNRIYTLKIACILNVEALGELLVFWLGAYLIMEGIISLGTLVAIMTLLGYVLAPIRGLVEIQNKVQKSIVSVERMNDVLESSTEDYEDNKKNEEISLKGNIVFENIIFSYGYQNTLLDAINLTIKQGEKVAFAGKNGTGKTTIINLLLRFYEPLTGCITINGRDIQTIPLNMIRDKIAYIEQETFLFADTLRKNLTMEEGKDRDEVTSNLDGGMQKHILEMIDTEYPETTCIFISHDKEVVQKCDYIFVIGDGKIIESRTYLSLMKTGGAFTEIFS